MPSASERTTKGGDLHVCPEPVILGVLKIPDGHPSLCPPVAPQASSAGQGEEPGPLEEDSRGQ